MTSVVKAFALLFIAQVVNYCLITYNYRMIAQFRVAEALLSDFLIASVTFFVIRKIVKEDSSLTLWFGYSLGSVAGTWVGMYASLWLHWK